MMKMLTATPRGGVYIVTPRTDQTARMLCVKVGQSVVLTCGEYALLRKADAESERWVAALDKQKA